MTTTSWVGEALDGAGSWKLRARVPWIVGLLMLFDSWDSVVIAFIQPVLIAQWGLTKLEASWIVSAGYGGQFIGAIAFGWLAERNGRLPVIKALVFAMSVLAVACAMAGSAKQLLVFRALQGLAIGGALPVAISYINEIAPTATRGRFFGTFQFLMTSGFGLAALLSTWLVPAFGWRIMFGLGALPLLVLPFTRVLPESPRWLAGKARVDEAAASLSKLGSGELPPSAARVSTAADLGKVPLSTLFEPGLRNTFIITLLLWFMTSLVSFGLSTNIVTIYVSMWGIPLDTALRYNAVVSVSIFILPLILRFSIDRIGRRPLPMFGTALCGVLLIAMTFFPTDARLKLVTLAIIGQIGISIGSMVLWPYTAETYATRVRATVLGVASSVARAASMVAPLIVGGILQEQNSASPVFLLFGVVALVVGLLWLSGVRETAGQKMSD